jgi:ribosomal protein L37AE/L43A
MQFKKIIPSPTLQPYLKYFTCKNCSHLVRRIWIKVVIFECCKWPIDGGFYGAKVLSKKKPARQILQAN